MFVLLTENRDDIIKAMIKLEKSISVPKKYGQVQNCKRWLKIIEKQVEKYCSMEDDLPNMLDVVVSFSAIKNLLNAEITNYEKGVKDV